LIQNRKQRSEDILNISEMLDLCKNWKQREKKRELREHREAIKLLPKIMQYK